MLTGRQNENAASCSGRRFTRKLANLHEMPALVTALRDHEGGLARRTPSSGFADAIPSAMECASRQHDGAYIEPSHRVRQVDCSNFGCANASLLEDACTRCERELLRGEVEQKIR